MTVKKEYHLTIFPAGRPHKTKYTTANHVSLHSRRPVQYSVTKKSGQVKLLQRAAQRPKINTSKEYETCNEQLSPFGGLCPILLKHD